MTSRRLLLVLPQHPHDPASGAARTLTTIGEYAACAGFEVRTVATTASESAHRPDPEWVAAGHGAADVRRSAVTMSYTHRCVRHRLLDADLADLPAAVDRELDSTLRRFRPHTVLIYGNVGGDAERRRRCRQAGARVVFALVHAGYTTRAFLSDVACTFTTSRFLTDLYRERLGILSRTLVTPLQGDDVLAAGGARKWLTMINPSLGKGATVLARILSLMAEARPDIPIQVVEGRGTRRLVAQLAASIGFDLRRHPALSFTPPTARPAEVFATTRALLTPSVEPDAAPRVVAEALLNGIPVIGSDRGGVPEMVGDGGRIVGLPAQITATSIRPLDPTQGGRWIDAVTDVVDSGHWRLAAERAGGRFCPHRAAHSYVEFLTSVSDS
jgi:glycosyltransferase involved in cell wall biosynthesis